MNRKFFVDTPEVNERVSRSATSKEREDALMSVINEQHQVMKSMYNTLVLMAQSQELFNNRQIKLMDAQRAMSKRIDTAIAISLALLAFAVIAAANIS
jgi:hypothetical protein